MSLEAAESSKPARPAAPPASGIRPRAMAVAAMRHVDHWLGLPLCFVLGIAVSLARLFLPRRRREIKPVGTLVVFKFFGLGSIMESTPLLRAIRKRYPEMELVYVTFDGNRELLEQTGLCSQVRAIRTRTPAVFVADVLATVWWMRRKKVQAVVDLELFSKFSTLLSFASGAHIRVGYHLNDFWRYSLVTHPIYFNYFHHMGDVFCDAGKEIDVTVDDRVLRPIDPGAQATESVRKWLADAGCPSDAPLLGVNVNAAELAFERRWPLESFAEAIAAALRDRPQLRVVLTGSKAERDYVQLLPPMLPEDLRGRVLVAAGQWSLREFLAGLPMFGAFLTNDSGPMHMAAAQGTPMVSLWGPTRPGFFAPGGDKHRVLWKDYHCSPCVGMFTTFEGMWCRHQASCMRAIPAREVIDAVGAVLSESGT